MELAPKIKIACDCARPSVAVMDYRKCTPTNWNGGTVRVNRVCTNCWSHWFGPIGKVKQLTKAKWDRLLNAPDPMTAAERKARRAA